MGEMTENLCHFLTNVWVDGHIAHKISRIHPTGKAQQRAWHFSKFFFFFFSFRVDGLEYLMRTS